MPEIKAVAFLSKFRGFPGGWHNQTNTAFNVVLFGNRETFRFNTAQVVAQVSWEYKREYYY